MAEEPISIREMGFGLVAWGGRLDGSPLCTGLVQIFANLGRSKHSK